MARHVEQAVQSGGAEQDEGMGGGADAKEVAVKFQSQGGFVQNAAVGFHEGGNLVRAKIASGGDGGLDEGELCRADAAGGIIRGVFVAKGVGGFECGKKFGFAFLHSW